MAPLPRKVLMLHGYAQNGSIFSKKMAALQKSCGQDIELVFIDAPYVLHPADPAWSSTSPLASCETSNSDPILAPRAWWSFAQHDHTQGLGLDKGLALLKDVLKMDRYEGVFGFSQGAAIAALLTALLEKPHLYPPFLVDGQSPHPPFKFCVCVAGFIAQDRLATTLLSPYYSTPTLHVLGRNDVIVIEELTNVLINNSTNTRVERHDGGHFIPSKANWLSFLRDYMLDPLGNVPSPGLPSSSATNPGTKCANQVLRNYVRSHHRVVV